MGFGTGALVRGAYEGFTDAGREIERTEDRAMQRKRQGLQDELLEGQVSDARTARSRRETLENDPELRDPALDVVTYLETKAKKARELGDQKTYEEMITQVEGYKTKNYKKDFDRAMGRFLGTRGADPQALSDFTKKYWNAESVIKRNEDGSFDVTMRPVRTKGGKAVLPNQDGTVSTEKTITIEADGKHFNIPTIVNGQELDPEAAIAAWKSGQNKEVGVFDSAEEAEAAAQSRSDGLGEETKGETHRFKNIDELGMFAMQVANPEKYAEHLAKQRDEDKKQQGRVALERVKGEEARKTKAVEGDERRKTNAAKPRGGPGGADRVPAAVKVLKAKEETFRRLNPKATDEEVAAHLFPSRNTIGARDRLRLYQDIKKLSLDPEPKDEDIRRVAEAAEKFARGEGGAPAPGKKRIKFDSKGNEVSE